VSEDHVSHRKFWIAMTVLAVLIAAVLVVLASGALATWFDTDPESGVGMVLISAQPMQL
jgi:hypothetical protein